MEQTVKSSEEASVTFSKVFPQKKVATFTDLRTIQLAKPDPIEEGEILKGFLTFDPIDSFFTVISTAGSVNVVPYDNVVSIGN